MDESGSPPHPARLTGQRYFVIAGLIMHEAQWHGVSRELQQLRTNEKFRISGEIKWRYFGPDNKDADNSVSHLDQGLRDEFRNALFSIITARKSIRIIACIADTQAAYATSYVKDQEDLYHHAYRAVSERFQYHLQDLSRSLGDKQLGIVIADHRGKRQDEKLRAQHHMLIDRDSDFVSQYENYVETIFLTPSHLSTGIQLADMVAGAIGRAANSGEDRFMNLITPALRRSPEGKTEGWGLVKFPAKGWGEPSGGGQAP